MIASVSRDLLCQKMENDGEMEDWRGNSDLVIPNSACCINCFESKLEHEPFKRASDKF